jgi:hypothetical protein
MLDLSISCTVFELEFISKIQLLNKKLCDGAHDFLVEYRKPDLSVGTKHAHIYPKVPTWFWNFWLLHRFHHMSHVQSTVYMNANVKQMLSVATF